ncbi:MAG: alpha-hydroxy acid oxidase [Rhodospirillales bacterium]
MFQTAPICSWEDARRLARRRLPWMIFDYIDGAAGSGGADRRNRQRLNDIQLQPRVLKNVEHRSLKSSVLGQETGLPFGIAPMGMCNLSTPGADLMLARLAAKHKIPLGVSTAASTALEPMIEAAGGNAWFQLYFGGDEDVSHKLLDRAGAAGYETLIFTVDVPEVGRRPRELRRGFKMPFKIGPGQFIDFALHPRWSLATLAKGAPDLANFKAPGMDFDRTKSRARADWDFLARVRDNWKGRMVLKGVTAPSDALMARDAGVDAVEVSNHGGRQLESAPAAIDALARIRSAVGDDYPLLFDSGLRGGEDIVKTFATGADFTMVGRVLLYALAAGGERGLNDFVDLLAEEISLTLAQLGATSMDQISREMLVG